VEGADDEASNDEWKFSQAVEEVQISTVDAFQGAEKGALCR